MGVTNLLDQSLKSRPDIVELLLVVVVVVVVVEDIVVADDELEQASKVTAIGFIRSFFLKKFKLKCVNLFSFSLNS